MEINISDYLTQDEIKDIVTDELRSQIRNHFKNESEAGRLLSNLAHDIVFNEIDKITPEYSDVVIDKVKTILKKDLSHYVFRSHYLTGESQSFASKTIDQTIKENIDLFKQKIISDVLARDYSEDAFCKFEKLAESFTANIYDFLDAIRSKNK